MKVFQIRKRGGSFRTIYSPGRHERLAYRRLLPIVNGVAECTLDDSVVHGFMSGKSALTAAVRHVGREWTVSMDIQDFFDSVTPDMVQDHLLPETIDRCFVDGAPRQGLPTSPAVANIAAKSMDDAIVSAIQYRHIVYTRYADDLTFSGDGRCSQEWVLQAIPHLVEKHGFRLHPGKTETYWKHQGRRKILGIMVDDTVHSSRATRRRLRAAVHQRHDSQAGGLVEYMRLRFPKDFVAKQPGVARKHGSLLKIAKIDRGIVINE